MAPVESSADSLKFVFTAAATAGVTVNVTVDSPESLIGPIGLLAASAVQPAGTLSATEPAGSVPEPDFTCTVAWNDWPPTLKKRSNVMFSIVPTGRPPGSGMAAP